jgi:hypothetical protein
MAILNTPEKPWWMYREWVHMCGTIEWWCLIRTGDGIIHHLIPLVFWFPAKLDIPCISAVGDICCGTNAVPHLFFPQISYDNQGCVWFEAIRKRFGIALPPFPMAERWYVGKSPGSNSTPAQIEMSCRYVCKYPCRRCAWDKTTEVFN